MESKIGNLNATQRIDLRLALEEFVRAEDRLDSAKKDVADARQKVIEALEPAESILAIQINYRGFIVSKCDGGFALRPCVVLL